MALLNMFSGGNWLTTYLTAYSANLNRGTWSDAYNTFYNTTYSQATSTTFGTSHSTGFGFTTTWTASRLTDFYNCPHVDSRIPGIGKASDVKVGSAIELANEHLIEDVGIVSHSKEKTAEGWRIVTEDGPSLVCSESAPIQTIKGLFTPPELLGKKVAIRVCGVMSWSTVTECTPVGKIQVQHITVGDRCFWVGENDSGYILHHNKMSTWEEWETSWSTSQATSTTFITYYSTGLGFTTNWNVQTSNSTQLYYNTSWTSNWNVLTSRVTGN